jgi:hypothetical protein
MTVCTILRRRVLSGQFVQFAPQRDHVDAVGTAADGPLGDREVGIKKQRAFPGNLAVSYFLIKLLNAPILI